MMKSVIIAAALLAAGSVNAATVTQWNFNSATPDANTATGSTAPSIGSGTLSLIGGVTATFASGSASGGSSDTASSADNTAYNLTAFAAQGAGDKTRGIQFNVSTLGFQNVSVNYDLRHSNTSSSWEQFQYSLNGTTFTDFTTFNATTGDTWFNNRTVDLSSIAGANNNASFAFRVLETFAPGTSTYTASTAGSTYGTTSTWRFDMATVSGTAVAPVPEPTTYAMMLLGLGFMGLVARRKLSA